METYTAMTISHRLFIKVVSGSGTDLANAIATTISLHMKENV